MHGEHHQHHHDDYDDDGTDVYADALFALKIDDWIVKNPNVKEYTN